MLVFLDIDGVMIPARPWQQPEIMADGFPVFSANAIQALNKIVSKTDADIMLTTSHKSKHTIPEWKAMFKLRGIATSRVKSLPDNINYFSRKQEILNWFLENNIHEKFVIIDDDKSLNDLPEDIKNNLILTSGTIGLTEALADQAINKLLE